MIKILGLNINVNDFLAQVGHAFGVVFSLFVANSANLPPDVVTHVNQAVAGGIAVYNDIATLIHGSGWVGAALFVYNWLQHNAVVASPVNQPAAIQS